MSGKWAATWSVSAFLAPAPPRPRPVARGRARACERGRVGKDRRRDPVASLARPPPPWPPAPTRSARLSHDQGDPHLQQPRETAALQVLPALCEYSAAADQGEGESLAAGSALRATPSGAPRPFLRPSRLAVQGCQPRGGCEQGAYLSPRSHPPTWLFLGSSSARLLPGWFLGSAGEALETSRSGALACRATAAHLRPRAHWVSCLPAARGFC